MADWRTIKRPPADEEALEKLTEAAKLYDAYVDLAQINVFPGPAELGQATESDEPAVEQPIGLVMSPSPTGIAVYRRA
jgi:hypothetical protein